MLRFLRRRALMKGPLGSSRNWTIVWGALTGYQLLRRFTQSTPEVVLRERLEPGRTLIIRNGDRPVTVRGADVSVDE